MYYPFLRARQFELIAIRELAGEHALQGRIIPVLEPVKESRSNLNLAHKALVEHSQSAFLIVNPAVGEMQGDYRELSDYIDSIDGSRFLPAFNYTNNAEFILSILDEFDFTDCMLICYTNYNDDAVLRSLCEDERITHLMIYEPERNRSLDRFMKQRGKTCIRLDDVFETQERNADFLSIVAHKFSEEHLYYESEGNYQGFSDFTVLSSGFIEGGSTPRAVVIHLTYINEDEENQIWIRHFTSETNDSIANVQGKFAEAAQKAIEFCAEQGLDNSAIDELKDYYDAERYPGLGIVKKISIKNHLLVVRSYLS